MNFYSYLKHKKKEILISLFFLIIFIIGINVFKDYNIYSDEPFHKWSGSLYYNFIKEFLTTFNFNNNYFKEIEINLSIEGYKFWFMYPMFFELFSEFFIDLFNFSGQNSYFFRHFLNFLFFFISIIYLFSLINNRFNNLYFAALSVLILFFTPIIFSQAFFNTKDILFLSLVIISIFYSKKFLENSSTKNLIIYSIISGIMLNVRIFGILFIFLTIFLYFLGETNTKNILIKKIINSLFSLFIIFFIFFLFFPFLWSSPIDNFLFYLNYLLEGVYNVSNLYFSKVYTSKNLPLHYIPVWMLITLPLPVFLISLFGLFKIFSNFIARLDYIDNSKSLYADKNELLDFFILFTFISSFFIAIFGGHNQGTWRYFYFIYPLIIYFTIFALRSIQKYNMRLFFITLVIITINLSYNISWIVKNHPFQNVNFNFIQKIIIKKNFELDFWGNSDKYMIEHLLKNSDGLIKVSGIGHMWINGTFEIFNDEDKSRLNAVSLYDADFIIDRNSPVYKNQKIRNYIKNNFVSYYSLVVDGKILNKIYKRKK